AVRRRGGHPGASALAALLAHGRRDGILGAWQGRAPLRPGARIAGDGLRRRCPAPGGNSVASPTQTTSTASATRKAIKAVPASSTYMVWRSQHMSLVSSES